MINRTVLVGRITRDPELRYTANGAAVANFTVAVNRTFKNAQGEREADFISCIIWRKAAENFANLIHKGTLVGIDGRIQTSSYENQQGQRVYRTDVNVDNFSKLERDNDSGDTSHDNSNQSNQSQYGNSNKQSNNNSSNNDDPFADGKQVDISDDSLPF